MGFARILARSVPRTSMTPLRPTARKYASAGPAATPPPPPAPSSGGGGDNTTLIYTGAAVAIAGLGYYMFAGDSSAKGKAQGMADEAEGKAKGLMNQAEGKANELAGKAKGQYNEAMGDAKKAVK